MLVKGAAPKTPDSEKGENRKMDETKRKRRYMQIRLTDAEYEAVEKKFQNSGMKSRSQFIITMILQGFLAYIDKEQVCEMIYQMSNVSNNINQIARRVNETGHIYDEDIAEMKEQIQQISDNTNLLRKQIYYLSK